MRQMCTRGCSIVLVHGKAERGVANRGTCVLYCDWESRVSQGLWQNRTIGLTFLFENKEQEPRCDQRAEKIIERAGGVVGNARVQRMSDAEISGIIANGVPDTGMPAFHALTSEQVRAIVEYLRSRQVQENAQPLPGDPVPGRAVFFGKGECSSCHMMQGEGGFLGPDLSACGTTRPAKDISDVIIKPARIPDPAFRMAVATTRTGERISGIVRNEDNFSVQLQSEDGAFHFLARSDLRKLDCQSKPAMPANYGQKLDRKELDDLVSYIISVGRKAKPDTVSADEDPREE